MTATLRVQPPAELDIATAETLLDQVRTALVEQPAAIVVDLAGVTFCDSSGIGALMDAQAIAASAGVPLHATAARPAIRRSLEITGVLGLLTPAAA
ncbi:STAS domain-containing protein [Actinoplanes sp. NPDC049548]|uniref:STAS domain-containing protein n=1 Tax=Actinoplanes sp. NPDC049548 TaxID=3155152 RepID=UPI003446F5C3